MFAISLMALRLVSFETVNHPGLGAAQSNPFFCSLLKCQKVLFCALSGIFVDFFTTFEFNLECKLSDEGFVFAACAPQSYIALAHLSLMKSIWPSGRRTFSNDALVHQPTCSSAFLKVRSAGKLVVMVFIAITVFLVNWLRRNRQLCE